MVDFLTATALGTIGFIQTDLLIPEPSDAVPIKWLASGVFGTAATLYLGDEIFPKPWHTDRPKNTIPEYNRSSGGGNGNWSEWLLGGAATGGAIYMYEKNKEKHKLTLDSPLPKLVPKDNTNVILPIIKQPFPIKE